MAVATATDYAIARRQGERGLFGRMFDRVIAARHLQAQRAVAAHLLSHDDATLARLGYARAELTRIAAVPATSL